MGHCIRLFVIGEEGSKKLKIVHPSIQLTEPKNGYVLVDPYSLPEQPKDDFIISNIWKLKWLEQNAESPVTWVETDYFGGMGDQSATSCVNGIITTFEDNINGGLKQIGVVKDSQFESDEFDWVGLNRFRSNRDAFDEEETEI
jgi:hypothetical protein